MGYTYMYISLSLSLSLSFCRINSYTNTHIHIYIYICTYIHMNKFINPATGLRALGGHVWEYECPRSCHLPARMRFLEKVATRSRDL